MKTVSSCHVDQRNAPRFYEAVPFKMFVLQGGGNRSPHKFSDEVTFDISEGGLRFYDKVEIPDDALLELHMHIPSQGEFIRQQARVRWKAPATDQPGYDIGVQFVESTDQDRRAWLQYIHQHRSVSAA